MSNEAKGGLVFVVAISSFTKRGFVGSVSYQGRPVEIEFDDLDAGVFLTADMCRQIGVRTGSRVLALVEANGTPKSAESTIAGVTAKARISSAKVYYEIGKEGGGVVTVRKD